MILSYLNPCLTKLKKSPIKKPRGKSETFLTMCESKGYLYFPKTENIENFLYYQFNTLKGQSGAPVFLRIKNVQNKNNDFNSFDPTVHPYSYIMIGLHIRRGPNKISPFLTDFQSFQTENESKPIVNPNNNTILNTNVNNKETGLSDLNKQNNTDLKPNLKQDSFNINETSKLLKKENGECEYNISLKLNKNILSQIQNLIKEIIIHSISIKILIILMFQLPLVTASTNLL